MDASAKSCKARLAVVKESGESTVTVFAEHSHPYSDSEKCKISSKLFHKGVLFYRHYTNGDKTYWRCSKINSDRCPARLCTAEGGGVTELNSHNHIISFCKIPITKDGFIVTNSSF